jgi:hypothetical protein
LNAFIPQGSPYEPFRAWKKVFSQGISSTTVIVRALGYAQTAEAMQLSLFSFPDLDHVKLYLPTHISMSSFGVAEYTAFLKALQLLGNTGKVMNSKHRSRF